MADYKSPVRVILGIIRFGSGVLHQELSDLETALCSCLPTMTDLPKTMRALIAPNNSGPSGYVVRDFATPQISAPGQVIVRSHAAALGAGEVLMTAGQFDRILKLE
jgi:hypothetical protein